MAGNNIYVQGSYIDVHDNENVYLSVDKAEVSVNEKSGAKKDAPALPEVLATDEAAALLRRLAERRMLGDDWQPAGLSGTERAIVAKALSQRLGIDEVWQVFGRLWGEKPATLRSYYNKALEQKKSLEFQDKLKSVIG